MQTKNFKFISSVIVTLVIITLLMFFVYNKQKNIDNKTALHLVFAIDIIRHGDRTPLTYVPYFSNHWLQYPKSTLTIKGQQESKQLGQKLAKYYIRQRKFLPNKCNENKILIQTTKAQRTKDTAKNIIQGLYPDATNINIESPTANNPLLPEAYSHNHLLRSFYKNTSQKTLREMKDTIKEVNKILNTNFTLDDLEIIHDSIKVNEAHNITPSKKLPQAYHTKLDIQGTIALHNAIKSTSLSCTASLPLANNIIELLNEFTIKRKEQYILYVTHDIMVWGLLNLISGKTTDNHPPYLADIRVELFRGISKELYVRLSYNNKIIKPCGTTFCKLDKFQTYINKNLQTCYNL